MQRHHVEQVRIGRDHPVADLDLAVVGGDEQRRPGNEDVEDVADDAVGGAQLGVVEVAEAAFVGGLVDAPVVGVHEALPGAQLATDLHGDRRRGPVADRPRAAQVGFGEGVCSSSAGEITGTSAPRKAANGCTSRGGSERRRSPPAATQRSTLITSPCTYMR